jgi:hypothetical protein
MAPHTPIIELSREQQTEQSISSFALTNRLSRAEVRLKRANRFSDTFCRQMEEIRDSINGLADSLILEEDVRRSLEVIENRVTEFEQRIAG